MVIIYSDGSKDRYPIAAAGSFQTYWLTPAQELGLELIPLIDMYIKFVDESSAKELLQELRLVYKYHVDRNIPKDTRELDRMYAAINKLEDLILHWKEIEEIGFY